MNRPNLKRLHLKRFLRLFFSHNTVIVLLLLLQICLLLAIALFFQPYQVYFYSIFTVLSVILFIVILHEESNPMYKLAWAIPVLVSPVFGCIAYIYVRLAPETKLINRRIHMIMQQTRPLLETSIGVEDNLKKESEQVFGLSQYVDNWGGYPIYQNTSAHFLPIGEDFYLSLLYHIERAKSFIFLEFFIIEEGMMWDSILNALVKKAKEGVEVRVLYDGLCSFLLLPYYYPNKLHALGIKCKQFSPIRPVLTTYQNNRDHRKIVVIDGEYAYTGGINLADEYINQKERFGHWKDTAIQIKGDAVDSFTLMFLQLWNIHEKEQDDYGLYLNRHGRQLGYVMPYGDSPVDGENIGEFVYLHMIQQATRYIHIMTPYLILDHEMQISLEFAAKRGVDVKIIMPHIPDKKMPFYLARTYYSQLIQAGVHIYEYTPGFIHAKEFIVDGEAATVGSINLDYRSLYLHFECACYVYRNPVITEIEQDFQKTLEVCHCMTLSDCRHLPLYQKIVGLFSKMIAPML